MNKFILIGVATAGLASARAQDAAASTPVPSDVESLRQQVQALTETVKELQQQMKDQQAAIGKTNGTARASSPNPEGSPVAAATSPSPAASTAAHFATEDAAVVSSTPTSSPNVNANGTAVSGNFPTTDTSVVSSAPETISSTGTGASLTQPISIGGGGKNYMNISFDGLFALAGSSARDLDAAVVSSTPTSSPNVNANGTAVSGNFPTTDTSVVSSAPETISSTGTGASLTQPISIGGGGKNYMNISFDGLFALAGSSARD